jgi:hypothetical protein
MVEIPLHLLLHLPTPDDLPWIPRPKESHHVFGAGLMFVAALLAAESLSGKVWHRSMVRRMLFPGVLVFLGWGMVIVAFIEPAARLVHVSMGLPMIAGGWAEARYRLGQLDRKYADALVVPVISHVGLGILVVVMAGLRVYQSAQPGSLSRSLLISLGMTLIGLDLWLDAFFQTNI